MHAAKPFLIHGSPARQHHFSTNPQPYAKLILAMSISSIEHGLEARQSGQLT